MTHWREILRTTPMRLTLRLVVLFVAASLGAFAVTWWLANEALLDATETVLEQQIDELSAADEPQAIGQAVKAAVKRSDSDHLLLRYDGPDGTVGNYLGRLPPGKFRQSDLEDEQHDVDGHYILLGKNVAGGTLTVGQDAEALTELRDVFIQVLTFTLLPTALLVLTGGVFIALRSARRAAAIEDTLARLTAGDLAARLPVLTGPPDDLTRVGSAIDRLAAAQEASVAALRQVSADIAHDLKTPIQRLAVLLSEARDKAPHLEVLDRASAEIDGIVATFQSLLRIAQIEGGSPRSRFAPVDLGSLAETMVELYEAAAEETGHNLHLTLTDPATIKGDRMLLGQLLANLIENALRHTSSGAITVFVENASLIVADKGPGIPKEERQAVLRRLYRLDRSRSTPGNGLGLSLVDAIVKLHDGSLVLSDNDPGLRVTVRFAEFTEM
ncbi:MAG: HAMP domain-containing histidine kinase [Hyphomicrobiales bacterium]|nr:HAMP domain-containing histidine kinase [Hyphomicrobiales bacterium]